MNLKKNGKPKCTNWRRCIMSLPSISIRLINKSWFPWIIIILANVGTLKWWCADILFANNAIKGSIRHFFSKCKLHVYVKMHAS